MFLPGIKAVFLIVPEQPYRRSTLEVNAWGLGHNIF